MYIFEALPMYIPGKSRFSFTSILKGLSFADKHPKYEAGTPGGKGGQFMPKGSSDYNEAIADAKINAKNFSDHLKAGGKDQDVATKNKAWYVAESVKEAHAKGVNPEHMAEELTTAGLTQWQKRKHNLPLTSKEKELTDKAMAAAYKQYNAKMAAKKTQEHKDLLKQADEAKNLHGENSKEYKVLMSKANKAAAKAMEYGKSPEEVAKVSEEVSTEKDSEKEAKKKALYDAALISAKNSHLGVQDDAHDSIHAAAYHAARQGNLLSEDDTKEIQQKAIADNNAKVAKGIENLAHAKALHAKYQHFKNHPVGSDNFNKYKQASKDYNHHYTTGADEHGLNSEDKSTGVKKGYALHNAGNYGVPIISPNGTPEHNPTTQDTTTPSVLSSTPIAQSVTQQPVHSIPTQEEQPTPSSNTATSASVSNSSIPETTNTTQSSGTEPLSHLDTPSKIKNAIYDASHKVHSAVSGASQSSDHSVAAANHLNAVVAHAKKNNIKAEDISHFITAGITDAGQGIHKLPLKSKSKNKLPLAAQSAKDKALNAQSDVQHQEQVTQPITSTPVSSQESTTKPLVQPTPSDSSLDGIAIHEGINSISTAPLDIDPHKLSTLDTPSKIKNAIYSSSHAVEKLNIEDEDKEATNFKNAIAYKEAVIAHAKSKGLHHLDIHSLTAKGIEHANENTFKLPFKAKSKNKLPLAAQSSGVASSGLDTHAESNSAVVSPVNIPNLATSLAAKPKKPKKVAPKYLDPVPVGTSEDQFGLKHLDTKQKTLNAIYAIAHKRKLLTMRGDSEGAIKFDAQSQAIFSHGLHQGISFNKRSMARYNGGKDASNNKYELPHPQDKHKLVETTAVGATPSTEAPSMGESIPTQTPDLVPKPASSSISTAGSNTTTDNTASTTTPAAMGTSNIGSPGDATHKGLPTTKPEAEDLYKTLAKNYYTLRKFHSGNKEHSDVKSAYDEWDKVRQHMKSNLGYASTTLSDISNKCKSEAESAYDQAEAAKLKVKQDAKDNLKNLYEGYYVKALVKGEDHPDSQAMKPSIATALEEAKKHFNDSTLNGVKMEAKNKASILKDQKVDSAEFSVYSSSHAAHMAEHLNGNGSAEHLAAINAHNSNVSKHLAEGYINNDRVTKGEKEAGVKAKEDIARLKQFQDMVGNPAKVAKYYDDNVDRFKFLEGDNKAKLLEDGIDAYTPLSAFAKQCITAYTGSSFTEINKDLIKGNPSKTVNSLTESLDKPLGQDLMLRRNMATKWFMKSFGLAKDTSSRGELQNINPDKLQELVGKIYHEQAFSSTSYDPQNNITFANECTKTGSIQLHIRADKDIARGIAIDKNSSNSGEREVMLQQGAVYVIRKVERKANSIGKFDYDIHVDLMGHMISNPKA